MSDLPKLLLLGDSIRMSYQPHVTKLLDGKAEVVGPTDNCQFSLYTKSSIPRWVTQLGKPDIVHWNNGIHDAGHNPARSPVQIPLDDYIGNLRHIADHIRDNLTTKLVFATSTPPHPDKPWIDDGWSWKHGDIERYNEAAVTLMNELNIPVNDLYGVIRADVDNLISDDQLHLSPDGQKACAEKVVEAVMPFLE